MTKKLAIVSIVTAFIVGAIAAGGIVGHFFVRRLVITNRILDYQFECQPEISTSLVSISALKKLHSDDISSSNTVEYLELQLDYAIAGIEKYVEHNSLSESNSFPAMLPVLRSAKRYREQFPHTNQDVIVEKDIESAFSLIEDKAKH